MTKEYRKKYPNCNTLINNKYDIQMSQISVCLDNSIANELRQQKKRNSEIKQQTKQSSFRAKTCICDI